MASSSAAWSGKKVHQSALVIMPEPGTSLYAAIQDIRAKHDRHFQRWPPHINVLYPFVPDTEFGQASKVLHESLSGVKPFEMTFHRIGYFEHNKRSCTAWLAPQQADVEDDPGHRQASHPTPHPDVISLQAICQAAIPHCNDLTPSLGGVYTPHHSIGQFQSKQDVQAFIQNLAWQPSTVHVNKVYLISREGASDPFKIRYIVPLGGKGPVERVYHPLPLPSIDNPNPKQAKSASSTSTAVSPTTANPAEIEIDGSILEGGGQVLRVSIALATLLQKSLCIHSIRAGRSKPGLAAQHLAGVKLVADIGNASLCGGIMGSTEIRLDPPPEAGPERRQDFHADPGTAGSITLLLQAALPCLAFSPGFDPQNEEERCIRLSLKGGTTVSHSPAIDYFIHVTAPLLDKMGLKTSTRVHRRGYYPQGGGHVEVTIDPCKKLQPLQSLDNGNPTKIFAVISGIVDDGGSAQSILTKLDGAIRAAISSSAAFGTLPIEITTNVKTQHRGGGGGGEGNNRGKRARIRLKREVLHLLFVLETSTGCRLGADHLIEDLRNFRTSPEDVVTSLIQKVQKDYQSGACVDEYSQDQLVIYMALAEGVSRVKGPAKQARTSLHVETAIHMAERITGVRFKSSLAEMMVPEEASPIETLQVEGLGFCRS